MKNRNCRHSDTPRGITPSVYTNPVWRKGPWIGFEKRSVRLCGLPLFGFLLAVLLGLNWIQPANAGDDCPLFTAGPTYAVQSRPSSFAVGDFNRDGNPDLAVVDETWYGSVSVLIGNGDGTFQEGVLYYTGMFPRSVAVGDFNGDGNPDLAVANACLFAAYWRMPSLSVLLGNGDGTFLVTGPYFSANWDGPLCVTVGDFNADSKLDVALGSYGGASVAVLLGNGDGTFGDTVNYLGDVVADFLAVGDFNRDGKLDLAGVDNAASFVSVLLGNGDATFQDHAYYTVGTMYEKSVAVAVGDFNGDGKPDLAVSNSGWDYWPGSGSVSVLLGNGDGTFQDGVNYGAGSDYNFVAVGDFNRDGRLDLVAACNSGAAGPASVSVLLGNGDGTFPLPVMNYAVEMNPRSLAVGDFNGDGKPDLAAANFDNWGGKVSVLLGTCGGAQDQVSDLIARLQDMQMDAGLKNALGAKLRAALASLQRGNTAAACGELGAFLNQVRAQSGKKLTSDQAAQLSNEATRIRTVLGC